MVTAADKLEIMTLESAASDVPDMADPMYLLDAVFRLERAVTRIGNKRLANWHMSLSGYAAMKTLENRPNLSLAQLSRRCFVRPQTMTRLVAQLEERDFVQRSPHPESERAISLSLTESGRAALNDMDAEVLKINETLTEQLDDSGVTVLEQSLRKCALAVETELRALS
ncbi:DNA-binding MarR family transcriptional regulator [Rhodococcus sp. OAS809]